MKKSPVMIIFVAPFLFLNLVFGQWVSYNIPDLVNGYASSGNFLFAATFATLGGGGIYRSSDSGATWVPVNNGMGTSLPCYAIAANGSYLFAGSDSGVYISTNNGGSWSKSNSGLPTKKKGVGSFAMLGANIFVGTDSGVYLSTNNGTSWSAAKKGITNPNISSFTVIGTNIFASTSGGPLTDSGGVFLSTNNGNTWTKVNSGLTDTIIYSLTTSGTNIFAGTKSNGVFLSTDSGKNWTKTNMPYGIGQIYYLAASGSNIFAGTIASGIFLSTDNGANWIPYDTGLPAESQPGLFYTQSLAVIGTNVFSASGTTPPLVFRRSLCAEPPTLVLPANNNINQPLSFSFSWSPAIGINTDSYSIQVSTASTFSTTIVNQNGITGTSYNVSGLLNNTTYYWRVNAMNTYGTGVWSTVWKMTTLPTAPASPVLESPLSGAVNVALSPTLAWNSSTGAATYRIQVSTDAGFSAIIFDDSTPTATSKAIGSLTSSTSYFWRVNAKNAGGSSAWSMIWSFSTVPLVTGVPILSSPSNGSANIVLNPTLTWGATSGAATYRIQVSTDSGFGTTIIDDSTVMTTSKAIGPLTSSTVYFWRVNAKNLGGTSTWSTVWSFSTVPPIASIPILIAPANSSTNIAISPTLSWNPSTGAATYRIQLSTDAGFGTTIVDDSTVTITSKSIGPLTSNTLYYWRANAKNPGGTSTWSTVWNFTTIFVAAPSVPVLVAPNNSATGLGINPTLLWNKATGATSYRIQVSTALGFSSTFKDSSGVTDTALALKGLTNNKSYYWRVNATNAGGASTWASAWSFTTIAATAVILKQFEIQSLSCNENGNILRYALPKQCFVSLKYYDIQGRMLASFVNKPQDFGYYSLTLPISHWAKGIYIQEFKAGSFLKENHFVIIR